MFRATWALTVANVKSFYRDRAALFWTFAFPVLFVVLFGSIFSGSGSTTFDVGWVDLDRSAGAGQLREGFARVGDPPLLELSDRSEEDALAAMRAGDLDAVIVIPAGAGTAIGGAITGGAPAAPAEVRLYTDQSQRTSSQTLQQIVGQVVGAINQRLSGRPPVLAVSPQPIQTASISEAAYFVPSILAMALMQLGVFAAIPLAAQREKLILKRLGATPLRRWALVVSNILMRLLIAGLQAAIIIGIGIALFDVDVIGSPFVVAGLVALGAVTFTAIGYVIASYAKTEESANALTSIVQFPLMFLSGIFFPIDFMPEFLRPIAAVLPLTYLGDALRQVMVGGTPYVPLAVGVAILAGWLVASFAISARFFRWQ
jgi:ABC-2 type transport system permease protein